MLLHPCSSLSREEVVAASDSSIKVVTSERAGDLGAGPSLWSVLSDGLGRESAQGMRVGEPVSQLATPKFGMDLVRPEGLEPPTF